METSYSDALQPILDAVHEGIVGLDNDGLITFVNRTGARLLGWKRQDMPGTPIATLLRTDERIDLTRLVTAADASFRRQDGTELPVSYNVAPILVDGVPAGAVVGFHDVSARKLVEKEAERTLYELVSEQAARAEAEVMQTHLHRLFQQVPALVAITRGPDHVFELANPGFIESVGVSDLLGKPMSSALPTILSQGFGGLLDQVYATGVAWVGNEVGVKLDRDGQGEVERYYNFVYQPLFDTQQRVYGIMIHAVDVSEQVESRLELQRSEERFRRLSRELERSNSELDQFAYVTSHDLKAPLRGIANLSQWIEEDLTATLPDSSRDHLRLLRVRVHRMEALIDGILQFSRAGRVKSFAEPVDTHILITEIIELYATTQNVEFDIQPDLPAVVTEKVLLQQVFQNLIGNALKHAHSEAPCIRITGRQQGADVQYSVADNGPGIAPEFQDRIWGIFQTLNARDKVESTGIGLALVRKIVETRGGRVWVDSAPGEGATFHFTWPRIAGAEEAL